MKKENKLNEKILLRRKFTLKAIEDYFGERISEEQFKRIKVGIEQNSTRGLDEEDRKAVWTIRTNLEDPIYRTALCV